MSNKRFSDVAPNKTDKDGGKCPKYPSGSNKGPKEANFVQRPHHTGPKVDGPGEVPKA